MGESLTELEIQLIIGKQDDLTMHSNINQYRPFSLFYYLELPENALKLYRLSNIVFSMWE
jgi:hypothetical protein